MPDPETPSPEGFQQSIILAATDVYADSFQMTASAYTISLHYGLQLAESLIKPQAVIRMSPQHAKMTAIILRRLLKQYEESAGEILLLPALIADKEIDLSRDW